METLTAKNVVKTKTAKERYCILLPLDSLKGIYKVYTDTDESHLKQFHGYDESFTPDKRPAILSSEIDSIIMGIKLGVEVYIDGLEIDQDLMDEIFVYESLGGVQTFLGNVYQFLTRQAIKNATP